jgi:cyclase
MPCKRIVACLDVRGGRTVKGVRFASLRDAGSPEELAARYCADGIDELFLLDVSATAEERQTCLNTVRAVADSVNVPLTVGGGVRSVDDVAALLRAGADKVAINTAAVANPTLLERAASVFGAQCIVVAIDAIPGPARRSGVVTHAAKRTTSVDAVAWAKTAETFGAGEILLTSVDRDGTRRGFDLDLTRAVADAVSIGVVASGGAASPGSFADVFLQTGATAALAASILHTGETRVQAIKQYLAERDIEVRL